MTLIEKYNLIADPNFYNRVRMAAIQAATDVINDPSLTDQHDYAKSVINNPLSNEWLQPVVIAVMQNPSIGTTGNNSTDNDIQFVVNSVFPIFATKEIITNE